MTDKHNNKPNNSIKHELKHEIPDLAEKDIKAGFHIKELYPSQVKQNFKEQLKQELIDHHPKTMDNSSLTKKFSHKMEIKVLIAACIIGMAVLLYNFIGDGFSQFQMAEEGTPEIAEGPDEEQIERDEGVSFVETKEESESDRDDEAQDEEFYALDDSPLEEREATDLTDKFLHFIEVEIDKLPNTLEKYQLVDEELITDELIISYTKEEQMVTTFESESVEEDKSLSSLQDTARQFINTQYPIEKDFELEVYKEDEEEVSFNMLITLNDLLLFKEIGEINLRRDGEVISYQKNFESDALETTDEYPLLSRKQLERDIQKLITEELSRYSNLNISDTEIGYHYYEKQNVTIPVAKLLVGTETQREIACYIPLIDHPDKAFEIIVDDT